MILYLLFFSVLSDSMASNASISTNFSENIMCSYRGNLVIYNSSTVILDPKNIPVECAVIVYSSFSITVWSSIVVDEAILKSVTDLKKPVILTLVRENDYDDWLIILGPGGNAKDTKVLCDFATKHNIQGYVFRSISPYGDKLDDAVGANLIVYIKQLKQCGPELIIGVSISQSTVTNSSIFSELNDLITFYEVQIDELIQCSYSWQTTTENYTLTSHQYNKSTNHDFASGMRNIASYLKTTNISVSKLTYDVVIYPQIFDGVIIPSSYTQLCKGSFDRNKSCTQTSQDFYEMGQFVRNDSSGIIVRSVDRDDINNDCKCGSKFNAFISILAGFTGGSLTPCPNFDAQ